MAKKLTQQQHRQIKENQQKHLASYEQDEDAKSELLPARVITNYGKSIIAELTDKQLIRCLPRQNLEQIVCGDNVLIQILENGDAVVAAIQARDSLLKKPGFGGKLKPMAANIDQVVIVMAVRPQPNPYLIDRYLVATENLHADGLIILNKMDLAEDDSILSSLSEEYEKLGYQVLPTSISDAKSIYRLQQRLNHKTSILVGLSGVGKSALINTLLPDQNIRVGEVSAASGEGTHTTTGSILYHLPEGGDIIDSP
ncbi:MAG: ribosome small subunit-dependent GTPase A, partial [Arenicellales bacterium]